MVASRVDPPARGARDTSRAVRGGEGWDGFWSGVTSTGDGGDVLWDAGATDEIDRYGALLDAHADQSLPFIDIGCGNGRFTSGLAGGSRARSASTCRRLR